MGVGRYITPFSKKKKKAIGIQYDSEASAPHSPTSAWRPFLSVPAVEFEKGLFGRVETG